MPLDLESKHHALGFALCLLLIAIPGWHGKNECEAHDKNFLAWLKQELLTKEQVRVLEDAQETAWESREDAADASP